MHLNHKNTYRRGHHVDGLTLLMELRVTGWDVPTRQRFFFLLYRPFDFCRFGGLYGQKENELNVTVCFKHYVLLGLTCQRECCPTKPRCLWNCFIRTRAENPKFCTPSPVGNSVVLAMTPAKSGKNNVITKKNFRMWLSPHMTPLHPIGDFLTHSLVSGFRTWGKQDFCLWLQLMIPSSMAEILSMSPELMDDPQVINLTAVPLGPTKLGNA